MMVGKRPSRCAGDGCRDGPPWGGTPDADCSGADTWVTPMRVFPFGSVATSTATPLGRETPRLRVSCALLACYYFGCPTPKREGGSCSRSKRRLALIVG